VRAHPAGPRHGEVLPERHSSTPATDLNNLDPAIWPRNASRGADGEIRLAGADVRTLSAEFGTPLMVVDEDDFRSRCQDFASAFESAAAVHYAGKAFLCGSVARWVDSEGLGLDVASGGELAVALRAGFPAGRIAFHGSNKSMTELRTAVAAGVGAIVVDSFHEIARLVDLAADRAGGTGPRSVKEALTSSRAVAGGDNGEVTSARIPVMVRVTVGVEAHTHEFIATAHEDQKFGFSLSTGDAAEAVRRIVACDGLALVGLHSHIGSQIFDSAGFEVAAHRVVGLLKSILATYPQLAGTITTLDLGGGLGIAYTAEDTPTPPDVMAAALREIVTRECRLAGLTPPRIAVEPGRAIAGPGTVTVYEVGTIKDVVLDGGHVRRYVSVDGGMSDNIRTALYDADYTVTLASRTSEERPFPCRVVGKHCETGDIVVRDCFLPADIAVGDLLAVAATGAYCYAMSSNYNRMPRPAVVAVRHGAARTLLRRETDDDLMRLEEW
jgi:diaminopimelate decarboxylase